MVLTILCGYLDATESVFHEARRLQIQGGVARQQLSKMLRDELDKATRFITIAVEQIDSQLKLLEFEKTPDAATQGIKRRLTEVFQT